LPDLALAPSSAKGVTRSPGTVVAVLSSCGIVAALMQTLVVPLIPELPRLLDVSASSASWVLTATLLSGAVCTPIAGRLGDVYGKRRIVLISLSLLVVGATLSALTSELAPMVAGRALQGAAMGAIPLGISIMRDILPPERLGSAMALLSATLGAGGAIGLPLSAFLAQRADWHLLFWLAAVLGAISALLIRLMVPDSSIRSPARFDLPGTLGLVTGLSCFLLAVSKGGDWGWGSPTTIGLLVAAAVVLAGWTVLELRTREPLVDLRVSSRRQVLVTNVTTVAVGFAMYAQSLVLPQFLLAPQQSGYGLGQSLTAAGLCLMPGGLVIVVVSPLTARLSTLWGPRVPLLLGTLVVAAGYGAGALFMHTLTHLVLVSTVIAVGVALAYAAMPALIMQAVPVTETGAANGLNALMRSLGTSLASAATTALLAQTAMTLGGTPLPSERGLRIALVVAAGVALAGAALTTLMARPVPAAAASQR
jgi:MFS family permease